MAYKRDLKSILINPAFQWRFLALISLLLISLSTVFWIAVFRFFREFEEMGHSAALPPDHVFYVFLDKQEHSLNMMMLAAFFVVLGIGLAFGLWFSHRIAGPIHRLRLSLEEDVKKGRPSPIKFRKGDFFSEIPDAYNEMVKSVENSKIS